jgi:hypothetical protein
MRIHVGGVLDRGLPPPDLVRDLGVAEGRKVGVRVGVVADPVARSDRTGIVRVDPDPAAGHEEGGGRPGGSEDGEHRGHAGVAAAAVEGQRNHVVGGGQPGPLSSYQRGGKGGQVEFLPCLERLHGRIASAIAVAIPKATSSRL